MPINSSMSSIDQTLTLRAAIDIFVTENIEELLVWDEGDAKWIWMLTTADIIRLTMHSIKCTARGEPIGTQGWSRQTSRASWSGGTTQSPTSPSRSWCT